MESRTKHAELLARGRGIKVLMGGTHHFLDGGQTLMEGNYSLYPHIGQPPPFDGKQ